MLLVRQIGLAILALAAVAVFFVLAPEVSNEDAGDLYVGMIDFAESANELNKENTESAVHQQVVNGWYANDLLSIIALENARTAAQSTDDRTAALLTIAVLAIALWGATSVTPKPESLPIPIPAPGPESTEEANPTDNE
jgi:hypothetical protein